ncbi:MULTISPECIES: hypothetical protein [Streptomyces]|uniref:hypothetical protein n=1 Tax=Streptomyces TaxID=1883 RepID=UPI000A7B8703|nr:MULTISPECIES: hypothetical protein [Streptomyces]
MHGSAFLRLSDLTDEQTYGFLNQVIRAARDTDTGTLLPEGPVVASHQPFSTERTAA